MKGRLAAIFRTKTRDAWTEQFYGVDACVTPVLDMKEAQTAPKEKRRKLVVIRKRRRKRRVAEEGEATEMVPRRYVWVMSPVWLLEK